jgi:endosialidase-like protein
MNWWNRSVNVNVNRYNQFNRTNISNSNWSHNAAHRGNVPYSNAKVSQQFGQGGRDQARDNARQNLAQKGQGGKGQGGKGQGGKGQGGKNQGGMGQGGMGQGGMGDGGMGQGGMGQGQGGMGQGGMGQGQGGMGQGGMGQGGGGMAGGGGGMANFAGGGMGGGGMMGGGGGMGGGGRGGGGMGGGGMRSDVTLKHDIVLLGTLDNGLGFYRFAYNGSDTAYVGVMAQEVAQVRPDAVVRGRDGYLRVFYDKLGLTFQTYEQWLASGALVPSIVEQQ